MLERALAPANRWVLDHVQPRWVDYVVSNTMTDFNRWFNGFLWTYELKALVEDVIDEAPGVRTFVLRPNQHWKGFEPGQHIEIEVEIDGQAHRRCYSPSPRLNGRLAITVKRKQGGRVSGWMHEHVGAGTVISLHAPRGRFTWTGQRKVMMLCAGSGITPCHAMVTAMLMQPLTERPDVKVVAQFSDPQSVIFRKDLSDWRTVGIPVTTAFSRLAADEARAHGGVSRLDGRQLEKACPDLHERDIYLCGPDGFMTQMLEQLRGLGVDLRRVHTERFELADQAPAAAGEFPGEGAEVYFEHVNARITLTEADRGKTLLQLAHDRGITLESGCGKGACGTCKLTVHEGQACGNVLGSSVYLCTAFPGSRQLVLGA